MSQLISAFKNKLGRYASARTSSLAFWWLPVHNGNYRELQGARSVNGYYVDFTSKAGYTLHFDTNLVPLLNYKGTTGIRYNPCAIAQYGLGCFSRFLATGEEFDLYRAIKQGDWLCKELKEHGKIGGRWEYLYGADSFPEISYPFVSAIAQGQGISLLLRLHLVSGNLAFLRAAERAFIPFLHDVSVGGVTRVDKFKNLILEEIPTRRISCVLDGFVYALFGVYDYAQATNDTTAWSLYHRALKSLLVQMPQFDLGYWSRTDLLLRFPKMPASLFYHNVHIHQLDALHRITGIIEFKKYADRWRFCQQSVACRYYSQALKAGLKVAFY